MITPIRELRWEGGAVTMVEGDIGPCASGLRSALLDIQYGRSPDVYGWMRRVMIEER